MRMDFSSPVFFSRADTVHDTVQVQRELDMIGLPAGTLLRFSTVKLAEFDIIQRIRILALIDMHDHRFLPVVQGVDHVVLVTGIGVFCE